MSRRRRSNRVRLQVALEAARLMYFEDVTQYLDAKRLAAESVLGRSARGAGYRPGELPSNGEIREALLQLAALSEGSARSDRLAAMRVRALMVLQDLAPFHPRLIGSVWSGHVRRGSDIDVHVFVEHVQALEHDLDARGWSYDKDLVQIRTGTSFTEYVHVHVHGFGVPVELSVYPPDERRRTTRSSTDGKPIDRVSAKRLAACIEREHPEAWRLWLLRGAVPDLPADTHQGPFDGLVRDLNS